MAAKIKKESGFRYSVTGDLNFSSVPELWREGCEQFESLATTTSEEKHDNGGIVIDLSGVSRSDSSGLALLIEWMRFVKKRGMTINFQNIPLQMNNIAKVCGVDDKLPLS